MTQRLCDNTVILFTFQVCTAASGTKFTRKSQMGRFKVLSQELSQASVSTRDRLETLWNLIEFVSGTSLLTANQASLSSSLAVKVIVCVHFAFFVHFSIFLSPPSCFYASPPPPSPPPMHCPWSDSRGQQKCGSIFDFHNTHAVLAGFYGCNPAGEHGVGPTSPNPHPDCNGRSDHWAICLLMGSSCPAALSQCDYATICMFVSTHLTFTACIHW